MNALTDEFIVDLHIHSHFSRATSSQMNIEALYLWGKIKGIHIIGTGDFTHPLWFSELREKLEPAENGLYKLKDQYAKEQDKFVPQSCRENIIRFILTVEISTIYSKNGRVYKLHNLVIVPDFETASTINHRLNSVGNLKADGRPILGMDSKELLKITIESHPDSLFIPAHIWTPWFAMFGSRSGFNSIEEAFEELSPHIHAVETGLSSDPFMNWRLSSLECITLISNSDAHSPQKLGREANIIRSHLSYKDIVDSIKTNDDRFVGTIEFFPQEGKYHLDGHRLCNIRFTPSETKKNKGLCPRCHKALVVGVEHRVDELADRPTDYIPPHHKSVEYIIPLVEIVAEIYKVKSTSSKKVQEMYHKVIHTFGNEFDLLRNVPIDDIRRGGFPELSSGLDKMRKKDVYIEPGYDGVYGIIKVFENSNKKQNNNQLALEL